MSFPTSTATKVDLLEPVNRARTTTSSTISPSATTIPVLSTSLWTGSAAGILTIGLERIKYSGISGNTFTGCTRGYDDSTAATHGAGSIVKGNIVAAYHNALADEIISIEKATAGVVSVFNYMTDAQISDIVAGIGSIDVTAAIQEAFDSSIGIIHLPSGVYSITSATLSTPKVIYGDGVGSKFKIASATSNGIIVNSGAGYSVLRDFSVTSTVARTAGAGILLGNDAQVHGVHIQDLVIEKQYIGIDVNKAVNFHIKGCTLGGITGLTTLAQIRINNIGNADGGDSSVVSNLFDSGGGAVAQHVLYESGGGLKFALNKMLGATIGLKLNFNGAGTSSGLLLVTGNSFEGASDAEVSLDVTANSFGSIVISGNEFGGNPDSLVEINSASLSSIVVTGNLFYGLSSLVGLNVKGGTGIVIDGNTFINLVTGLSISDVVGVNDVSVGINNYYGCTMHVSDVGGKSVANFNSAVFLKPSVLPSFAGKALRLGYDSINEWSGIVSYDPGTLSHKKLRLEGSPIELLGGSVGVGINPATRFHVYGGNVFFENNLTDGTTGGQLVIRGSSNTDKQLFLGFDTTNDFGTLQAIEQGVGNRTLALQPAGGNVVIGGTSPNGKLDIQSTTSGVLIPRMTNTQMLAIDTPAEGLMAYDLTNHKLCVWDGSTWQVAW